MISSLWLITLYLFGTYGACEAFTPPIIPSISSSNSVFSLSPSLRSYAAFQPASQLYFQSSPPSTVLIPSSPSYQHGTTTNTNRRGPNLTVQFLSQKSDDEEEAVVSDVVKGGEPNTDPIFDGKVTLTLIGGQSTLILASIIAAIILQKPNYGLGSNFFLASPSIWYQGAIATLPLFGLAGACELIEDKVPALQDVSKATQRSVLTLLGSTRKPLTAIITSIALGLSAGIGEEMLFRGILQSELGMRFGTGVGIGITSLIFGALHAVTPLYAFLAGVASVFFGFLYQFGSGGNLAVPMVAHALYDIGALMWAHYVVTGMPKEEQMALYNGE